jgi:hypothetical protein
VIDPGMPNFFTYARAPAGPVAMADRLNFEIDVELETGLITGHAGDSRPWQHTFACLRPAETEDIVYQGLRIAVPPSAHGRGDVQTARMCHRTAVLLVKVSAGGSLLWSPLVTPTASTAMNTQRSQAPATSRPLGNR